MAINVTTINFRNGAADTLGELFWNGDYGQILKFEGIDLPASYEVDFSDEAKKGYAVPRLGDANGVEIPNELLKDGFIYAWIFLHEGATDGRTEYFAKIRVNARPTRSIPAATPEQAGFIEQAVASLENATEQATEAAETAAAAATTATEAKTDAEQAAQTASTAADRAEAATGHYPIIQNGYWYVWDAENDEYVTTGVKAEGEDGAKGDTGNGIASARLNADYTLTIVFTDGTSYTTPTSIRGAQGERGAQGVKGDTGNGIASTVLNADYTLTITFTDGTSYTTSSIRGAQGADYVLTTQDKSDIADIVVAEIGSADTMQF